MCILLYLSGILNYFKHSYLNWCNMTILSVPIQGYIARLFYIEINRKIFITIQ